MAVAFSLAVLTGCGAQGGAGTACTAIAGRTGIGLTIAAQVASELSGATVRLCQDDCVDIELPVCRDAGDCTSNGLRPGSETVDTGCSGDDPSDVCGASAVPTGELTGFVDYTELATGPAEVTVTLTDRRDTQILSETITAAAEATYPNGPDCGARGVSAAVSVTDQGVLVAS